MVNYPTLDTVFSALANPTRRAILQRLTEGEATVSDLADPFEMSLPGLLKHVRALEAAGLVTSRKAGREHLVTLVPQAMQPAAEWLDTYRRFWEARFDQLDAYLANTQDHTDSAIEEEQP